MKRWPDFEQLEDRCTILGEACALAAHEDFSGLVTPKNRARPGEIIHLYMTGLGSVEPAVETGAPAPADPPARVRTPLTCSFRGLEGPPREAQVLFAGLAPGYAGYYQVTLRIPEDVPIVYGNAVITCGATSYIPIGNVDPNGWVCARSPLTGEVQSDWRSTQLSAFIVRGPATIEVAILFGENERIHAPVFAARFDDIGMGQKQNRLELSGAMQAHHQVGFLGISPANENVGFCESGGS